MDKELILNTLLQIDDPFYLNTFKNSVDEDEWFRINEHFIQEDLQKYFPNSINTKDPQVWKFIKSKLMQFEIDTDQN